ATQASALAETVASLEATGVRGLTAAADVSSIDDVRAVAERTMAEFGRVDLVANIAGVMAAAGLPIWEITREQWSKTLGVKRDGVINGALVFVPILASQEHPTAIVNMGSISSYSRAPWRAPYNTSKIAVAGFTEALRAELAERHPNVRVMLVCPSAV